jgi:phosphoglycerol transferase MdoB-like AlkP superfamily enzyme
VSPRLKSGPVRPLFRLLALVVGPLLLCAGLLLVILDLRGVNAQGWPVWSRRLHAALWLGLGNLVLGWRILHAARTGVGPCDVAAGEHPPDEDRGR